jgi:hypothetical protein
MTETFKSFLPFLSAHLHASCLILPLPTINHQELKNFKNKNKNKTLLFGELPLLF